MTSIFAYRMDKFREFHELNKDPTVDGWLLMDSPYPTMLICAVYVAAVKFMAPQLMTERKPYNLRRLIMLYNVLVVSINSWLVYHGTIMFLTRYSLACQPVMRNHDLAVHDATVCWVFFLSKILDMADTAFLVLTKKEVMTLHFFHHAIMPISMWMMVRYVPGGHTVFAGMVNSYVHVVMYSYYFLASLGPSVRPYLWWKKYLTTLQLVQFVALFLHNFQLFFRECDYPKFIVYIQLFLAIVFFAMFTSFYKKTYAAKAARDKKN